MHEDGVGRIAVEPGAYEGEGGVDPGAVGVADAAGAGTLGGVVLLEVAVGDADLPEDLVAVPDGALDRVAQPSW